MITDWDFSVGGKHLRQLWTGRVKWFKRRFLHFMNRYSSHSGKYFFKHWTYNHTTQQLTLLGIYLREMTTIHAKISTWIFITSFICQNQDLETTKMAYHKWMVKQTVVQPYRGILLWIQKKPTADKCGNLMNLKGIMLSAKKKKLRWSHTVWYYLHDIKMEGWRTNGWLPAVREG